MPTSGGLWASTLTQTEQVGGESLVVELSLAGLDLTRRIPGVSDEHAPLVNTSLRART